MTDPLHMTATLRPDRRALDTFVLKINLFSWSPPLWLEGIILVVIRVKPAISSVTGHLNHYINIYISVPRPPSPSVGGCGYLRWTVWIQLGCGDDLQATHICCSNQGITPTHILSTNKKKNTADRKERETSGWKNVGWKRHRQRHMES